MNECTSEASDHVVVRSILKRCQRAAGDLSHEQDLRELNALSVHMQESHGLQSEHG